MPPSQEDDLQDIAVDDALFAGEHDAVATAEESLVPDLPGTPAAATTSRSDRHSRSLRTRRDPQPPAAVPPHLPGPAWEGATAVDASTQTESRNLRHRCKRSMSASCQLLRQYSVKERLAIAFLCVIPLILAIVVLSMSMFFVGQWMPEGPSSQPAATTTSSYTFSPTNEDGLVSENNLTYWCTEGVLADDMQCRDECPAGSVAVEDTEMLAQGVKVRTCSSTITTDIESIVQPMIMATSPLPGETMVPCTARLMLIFNTEVQPGLSSACVRLLPRSTDSAEPVIIPVSSAVFAHHSVQLMPPTILRPGTTYDVITDAFSFMDSSQRDALPLPFSFTTAPAASLNMVSMNVTLGGLSYAKLMSLPMEAEKVRQLLAQEVAAFSGVSVSDVRIQLKPGSVVGESRIVFNTRNSSEATRSILQTGRSELAGSIVTRLQDEDLAAVTEPGRSLQAELQIPDQESFVFGVPEVLAVYPEMAMDLEFASTNTSLPIDSEVRLQFSEPIQIGGPERVKAHASNSTVLLKLLEIRGAVVRLQLPGTSMKPGAIYRLVVEEGAFLSLTGANCTGEIRYFQSQGPQEGMWNCRAAAECEIGLLGDIPTDSLVGSSPLGGCAAKAAGHPSFQGPFQVAWAVVNVTNSSFLGPPASSEQQGPWEYSLCWRPSTDATFAVPFGTLVVDGPSVAGSDVDCSLGADCILDIPGSAHEDSLAIHRGDCDGDVLLQAVSSENRSLKNGLLQLGTDAVDALLAVCWSPRLMHEPPLVYVGELMVSGPFGLQSEGLAPAPSKPFDLTVVGLGMPISATIRLYHNSSCSIPSVDANRQLEFRISQTGFSGSRETSQRWQIPALDPGIYWVCWCHARSCNDPVAVGSFEVHVTVCGDGVREAFEECDDGNSEQDDGCSNCSIDAGYECLLRRGGDLCGELFDAALTATMKARKDGAQRLAEGLSWYVEADALDLCLQLAEPVALREMKLTLPPMFQNQEILIQLDLAELGRFQTLMLLSVTSPDEISDESLEDLRGFGLRLQTAEPIIACEHNRSNVSRSSDLAPQVCNLPVKYLPDTHTISIDFPMTAELVASQVNVAMNTSSWSQLGFQKVEMLAAKLPAIACPLLHRNFCASLHRPSRCFAGYTALNTCGECQEGYQGILAPSTEPCLAIPLQECLLSDWADWTQCSKTCGVGWHTRQREILQHPHSRAAACPKTIERSKCSLESCPIVAEFCINSSSTQAFASESPRERRLHQKDRRLREPSLQRPRFLADAPPEILRLVDHFDAIPHVSVAESSEESEQSCSLSARGEQAAYPLSSPNQEQRKCRDGFFVEQAIVKCRDSRSDDCSAASSLAESHCFVHLCCEPCAAGCKHCSGPGEHDCSQCQRGKLVLHHFDGRSECISRMQCEELGCHRPSNDGRCVPEVSIDCAHVALAFGSTEEALLHLAADDASCPGPQTASDEDLRPAVCTEFAAAVCTNNPRELCYRDASCMSPAPRSRGFGCGAGGHLQCRFCGFGDHEPCPKMASVAGSTSRRLASKKASTDKYGCKQQRKEHKYMNQQVTDKAFASMGASAAFEMARPKIVNFLEDHLEPGLSGGLARALNGSVGAKLQEQAEIARGALSAGLLQKLRVTWLDWTGPVVLLRSC
ncbi:Spon1 [Symbiodinium sp. CCMP2592]|nr:Spon1 [Symbiodinium sp. CCMP2592]